MTACLHGPMTVHDLAELLRPVPTAAPGRFVLEVPDGLRQGKGAWGGIPTGAMVSAVQQVDPRPELAVRTMSAQLVAPLLPGPADIRVEVLREGRGTTTAAARITDADGSLIAHGVVVLGAARTGEDVPDGPAWQLAAPPAELAAGPDAVAVVPIGPPVAPEFLQQLELRPLSGYPFQGGDAAEAIGWVRPARACRPEAAVVVALADAWWVAVMARLERPRPVGTLGFSIDLPIDPTSLPTDHRGVLLPLFHRGRTIAAREGYTVESRELWTVDGRLASWNTQTVAIIK